MYSPRHSAERNKFIQRRGYPRSPLLKTTALKGKLTFGDPFLDSGVASPSTFEQKRAYAHQIGGSEETQAPLGGLRMFRWDRIPMGNVTTFVPHTATKLNVSG